MPLLKYRISNACILRLWIFVCFLFIPALSGYSDSMFNAETSYIIKVTDGLPLTSNLLSSIRIKPRLVNSPPKGQIYHAVYPGHEGGTGEEDDITLEDLSSYEKAVGKSAAWVYFSHNWYHGRNFPTETVSWIRDGGSVPFIRLMLRDSAKQYKKNRKFTLKRILKGKFDVDLRSWASDARDFDSPLIVEFGTEVNGEWFPWNGKWNGGRKKKEYGDQTYPDGPERFRDAYRHIIDIMREEGASNITWVFHVNNDDVPNKPWNRFEKYYPGDDYIDWIGVSVYGAQTPTDKKWPLFSDMMDEVYPRLESLSTSKPIVVLEFAVTSGNSLGDQAEWANAALTDLTAINWPRIIGFSWWNEAWQNDDNQVHDTNMRVQDNSDLASVFQKLAGKQDHVLGSVVESE